MLYINKAIMFPNMSVHKFQMLLKILGFNIDHPYFRKMVYPGMYHFLRHLPVKRVWGLVFILVCGERIFQISFLSKTANADMTPSYFIKKKQEKHLLPTRSFCPGTLQVLLSKQVRQLCKISHDPIRAIQNCGK